MKVLLVEDEVALSDVLARNLRARGNTVRTAASAASAIFSLTEDWPDALILDINLPDESGWEVLRRLGEPARDSVRIIVISAAPISKKRIDEFRPAHWFLKPFPISALVRVLAEAPGADTALNLAGAN